MRGRRFATRASGKIMRNGCAICVQTRIMLSPFRTDMRYSVRSRKVETVNLPKGGLTGIATKSPHCKVTIQGRELSSTNK